jgi:hypothetical protein
MKYLLISLLLIGQISFSETKPKEAKLTPEGCNKTKGWGYFCQFNLDFEIKQQISAIGKIGSIEPITLDPKMSDGQLLKVIVSGQIIEFLLGPEWYLNNLDEVLLPGEEITVLGEQGYSLGKKWNRAHRLIRGQRTIELISRDGTLAWSAWKPIPKEKPRAKKPTTSK